MKNIQPPFGFKPNLNHPSLKGLVSWWMMNEGGGSIVHDISLNKNHGTMVAMIPATDWITTPRGKALDFDGVNDYIDVGDKLELSPSSSFTASVLVKYVGAAAEDYRTIISKSDGGGITHGFRIHMSLDTLYPRLLVATAGGNKSIVSSIAITITDWHLVTGVFTGTDVEIFVDGVSGGSSSFASTTMITTTNPFLIGNDNQVDNSHVWNGQLDDARFYNRALSAKEVAESFTNPYVSFPTAKIKQYATDLMGYPTKTFSYINQPKFGSNPNLAHPSLKGLEGWWPINEGGGEIVHDISGHGHHGSMVNMEQATDWINNSRGKALDFDGTDEYVDMGDVTAITGAITVSCWFKGTIDANLRMLISKYSTNFTAKREWYLGTYQSGIRATINAGPVTIKVASYPMTATTFKHFAMTWDGGSTSPIMLYVNGVEVPADQSINPPFTTIQNSDASLMIGARDGASVSYFPDGEIGDVRVYSRGFSSNEMKDLYINSYEAFEQRKRIFFTAAEVTDNQIVELPAPADYVLDSGTASSGASSFLYDTSKNWTNNEYQNNYVRITGGVGVGQTRRISANGSDDLIISPSWDTNPDATSTYQIFSNSNQILLNAFAPSVTTTENQIVEIPLSTLTLNTFAPTITATEPITGEVVELPLSTINLNTFAPNIITTENHTIELPLATLNLNTFAPTVTTTENHIIELSLATLNLNTFAPTIVVRDQAIVELPLATLNLNTFAPSVTTTENHIVELPLSTLTLNSFVPSVTATENRISNLPLATLTLNTFAPSVTTTVSVICRVSESKAFNEADAHDIYNEYDVNQECP